MNDTLTVVTTEKEQQMRFGEEQARRLVEQGVSVEKLRQGFSNFMSSLSQIVSLEQARVGVFVLEEISFSAEISAEGEFKLLGSGVGVSVNSAVSFTLRRQVADAKET